MTIDDTNMIDPPAGTYSDEPCDCGEPDCYGECLSAGEEAEERREAALEVKAEERMER